MITTRITGADGSEGARENRAPHLTVAPFESGASLLQTRIDACVLHRLKHLGIPASPLCSDAVFVRRVFLDLIGTLPTQEETEQFLQDTSPTKRTALIDRLLLREEFSDYWTLKWCDLLRVKSEFPINLWPNAVQAYHRWVRTSIRSNMPMDRFARTLLLANGSNFRDPEVNFYRTMQGRLPEAIAESVALTFMGVRADKWPKQKLAEMAGFFAQIGYKPTGEWKEEIVFFDPNKPLAGTTGSKLPAPVFPDGTRAHLTPGRDPREVFADWLVSSKDPWFSRSLANRAWYWLMGIGIVQEPDDIRPDNPPSNPELLALLQSELTAGHYNMRSLLRTICSSETYQRSSLPKVAAPTAEVNFACYPIRRLDAEVLIDAIDQISGTTESYSSPIPEPFTFIPESQRSIRLADGSISSAFLEMFGRPSRDTGRETERNNLSTSSQRLHMLNSSHIQRKLEYGPALQELVRSQPNQTGLLEALYLRILSRYPTNEEKQAIDAYAKRSALGKNALAFDVTWALVNSTEFLYRH